MTPETIFNEKMKDGMMRDMHALHVALLDAEEGVRKAILTFQEQMESSFYEQISPKLAHLNSVRGEAQVFIEATQEALEFLYEDGQEPWKESNDGEKFREWMEDWDVELPELDLEHPFITPLDEYPLPSEMLVELPTDCD